MLVEDGRGPGIAIVDDAANLGIAPPSAPTT
jgi:hypothetical protein